MMSFLIKLSWLWKDIEIKDKKRKNLNKMIPPFLN